MASGLEHETKFTRALRLHLANVNLPILYVQNHPPPAVRLEVTSPPTSPGIASISMPGGILSSNFITVPVLDSLLASPAGQEPSYRLQLLSTKLAILTNLPSQPHRRSFDTELQILQCRLEVAKVAVGLANLTLARGELGIVERECKGMIKRITREVRARSDREARRCITSERDREDQVVSGTTTPTGTGSGNAIGTAVGSGASPSTSTYGEESESGSGSTIKAIKRDIDIGIGSELSSLSTSSPSTSTTPNTSQSDPNLALSPITSSSSSDLDTQEILKAFSSSSTSATTPSPPLSEATTPSDSKVAKYQFRQGIIKKLRVEALRALGDLEELQGKPERRGRWDSLAMKLETSVD
jgi:hypothetical protein